MAQCYCFRGRKYFEPRSPRSDWSPTPDHDPRLRAHGGLSPDNVRLAHLLCNRRDYGWRMKIAALLEKRMSLEEIAARLNAQEGSADPRREQMNGYLCSEGVRFLDRPFPRRR